MSNNAKNLNTLNKTWANLPGWGALAAVNHTTIGKRFMVTGMIYFLIGGILAMILRTQIAQPEQNIITADFYNQAFTMHGTVMMFLFAIPALEGLAMYVIPKMIGARDLIFPRLSAFGYYCYLFGGLILLSSIFIGQAPDTGWFMYTPLSDSVFSPGMGADFWLLGITFVEISAISAAVELIVTILRGRTEGMSLRTMPIFCWYILGMSFMILFGFPPLILASILLELERASGLVFFAVEGGGDPLLWQHLFWLFGHPEVYILFLPAAGIISTLIPVFSGRPIIGYKWLVLSIILTGFISFGLWVHHMFTVGIPMLAQAFFSVASMLVAIPTGIQIFVWLGTMLTGRVRYSLPMLWVFGFLFIFVLGGMTGVMLALVPFDWQVHDTHFIVAHMHYVLVGGVLFPLMAGFYYWLPHFSGRMSFEKLGRWGFWLTFIGFNMTFFMMHVTGLLGMPRRIYTYDANLGWDGLNLLSSVGGFIMALGVAVIIIDFVLHFRYGRKAPHNPWNADTLEWATDLPPANYNFASLPKITTRHPMWDIKNLKKRIKAGEFALNNAPHGRRETFGTNGITGRLQEVFHLPDNSWLPLQSALALAGLCICLLIKSYYVAIGFLVLALFLLFRWSWHNGFQPATVPRHIQKNELPAPLHSHTAEGPGIWGMGSALLSNGTIYLSLLFGWLYLWTVAPEWDAAKGTPLNIYMLLFSGACLSAAVLIYSRALKNPTENKHKFYSHFGVASIFGIIHLASLFWTALNAGLSPVGNAHDSILVVMLIYLFLHSSVSIIATFMQIARIQKDLVKINPPNESLILKLFWNYTLGIFWLSFAAFILLPAGWGI